MTEFLTYTGKTYYCTDFLSCAIACDQLVNWANRNNDRFVLGFDMEWPVNFQTGSGKTALIQISPSLSECYLFHVFLLDKLPATLAGLLSHTNVRITGVNIRNDVRKLCRDFPGFDEQQILSNCIDLRNLANEVSDLRTWSMAKLVEHFLDGNIDKNPRVRMGKWDKIPLSQPQIAYAATDSYMSLKLYHHLTDLKSNNSNVST